MLKSVMNVLMVPVLGFALLIAVSRAEDFPVDPVIFCNNIGCAPDEVDPGQCAGVCLPAANCECRVNPLYDKTDPDTGLPCYCHNIGPEPVDL